MADKITIEIYKTKDADDLTKLLADPEGRLETGSAAAVTASLAAALLCRAAALALAEEGSSERLNYVARNGDILRGYMVHLIDEDVKSRGPLRRALQEGDIQKIDAARRPAVSICEEIINMMGKCLDLLSELCEVCPVQARHYVRSAADLAMGAIRSAMHYVLDMSQKSSEETYRFVTHRENEITLANCQELYERILAAK